jgi:hypothetical protein
MQVKYLPTDTIPSDVLTKALSIEDHRKHSNVLLGYKQLVWTNEKATKKKPRSLQ